MFQYIDQEVVDSKFSSETSFSAASSKSNIFKTNKAHRKEREGLQVPEDRVETCVSDFKQGLLSTLAFGFALENCTKRS